MADALDPSTVRMRREDALHLGAVRPLRILGLPMQLATLLGGLGYIIQINITGWQGFVWALAIVGPFWVVGYILTAHDPYGCSVGFAWARTTVLMFDKATWGGASCAPLPASGSTRSWKRRA